MQKSYLKNMISVLHIILDISNVKIQEYSIYTEIVSYKHYFKNIANLHSHALEEPSIWELGRESELKFDINKFLVIWLVYI